jgi:triphosphoribosyl-dephospho-CoA synthase
VTPLQVARAFRWACEAELRALKPGNVHVHGDGHGMTVTLFRRSARAAAPWLSAAGLPLGERVLGAVAATQNAVGLNTNLGIVLLAAPLCHAALMHPRLLLPDAVAHTLARATRADARAVFQAIALAAPAGLGTRTTEDVRGAPRIGLVDAMRLAARRDLVARQYASNFGTVLKAGQISLRKDLALGLSIEAATTRLHMAFLRRFPDSHIGRKHGARVAASVRDEAQRVPDASRALRSFDRSLKKRGLNPGTTADLVVASLLAHRLTSIVPAAA